MMPQKKEKDNLKSKRVIFLIGSTGKGKSTLANVLVNEVRDGQFKNFREIFKESGASVSGTREIQKEEFIEENINYAIIDTVGIGDTKLKREEILDKIAEAVYLAREGISQILFVINGRLEQYEMANYDLLRTIIFDDKVVNHTTITRTRFEDFTKSEKCQEDIDLMIEEGGKLAEIINSCQKKVIHVDNPSLNLVPAKNESEDRKRKREDRIAKRKKARSASRELLLKHLRENCRMTYKPPKLEKLSGEIFDYMKDKEEKRKELEEKRKKLGLETKNEEEERMITDLEFANENNESTSNKTESVISEKEEVIFPQNFSDNRPSLSRIKEKIIQLENDMNELEEVKKLQKEIQSINESVREVVRKHILNNYEDTNKVLGGEIFTKSTKDNAYLSELSWGELLKKDAELGKKLQEKGVNNQSLKQVEDKIKQKEQELIKLKKQQLDIKEISEKWQSQGFNMQQARGWVDALGVGFNPESDVSFCAWLRDEEKSVAKKIKELNYVINAEELEELRKRYAQWLEKEVNSLDKHNHKPDKGEKKYTLTKENFQKLIQLTFSKEVAQFHQTAAQTAAQANQTQAQTWAQAFQTAAQDYQAQAEALAQVRAFQTQAQANQTQAQANQTQAFQASAQAWAQAAQDQSPQTWAQAFQASAQEYQAQAQAFQTRAQASAQEYQAQARQDAARAFQTQAQHLKINLTLENIESFFIEVKEESEEGKVEISVSIENKPKN